MTLSNKRTAFVNEYLVDFNATQAAIRAGYAVRSARQQANRMLTKDDIRTEIKAHLDEMTMGVDEILVGLTTQARGDLGVFFKLVEEWTFYPLPTYDIIDAKEVEDTSDPDKPIKRISYWVRHVALDMDKLIDPNYSHLLHKFSDSPKDGLGIEIYNKQTALQTLAKIRGLMINKLDVTSGGEALKENNNGLNRAISTLSDVIRETISRPDAKETGSMVATEQAAMVSPSKQSG